MSVSSFLSVLCLGPGPGSGAVPPGSSPAEDRTVGDSVSSDTELLDNPILCSAAEEKRPTAARVAQERSVARMALKLPSLGPVPPVSPPAAAPAPRHSAGHHRSSFRFEDRTVRGSAGKASEGSEVRILSSPSPLRHGKPTRRERGGAPLLCDVSSVRSIHFPPVVSSAAATPSVEHRSSSPDSAAHRSLVGRCANRPIAWTCFCTLSRRQALYEKGDRAMDGGASVQKKSLMRCISICILYLFLVLSSLILPTWVSNVKEAVLIRRGSGVWAGRFAFLRRYFTLRCSLRLAERSGTIAVWKPNLIMAIHFLSLSLSVHGKKVNTPVGLVLTTTTVGLVLTTTTVGLVLTTTTGVGIKFVALASLIRSSRVVIYLPLIESIPSAFCGNIY
eukprot:gene6353-4579_t